MAIRERGRVKPEIYCRVICIMNMQFIKTEKGVKDARLVNYEMTIELNIYDFLSAFGK
jgi:hypothetical protein